MADEGAVAVCREFTRRALDQDRIATALDTRIEMIVTDTRRFETD